MPDAPTPNPAPAPLSSDEQIIASLRRIIRAVDLHSRKLMEHSGMTGPQLAALQEIHRQGTVSAGEVARAIHLSQGTVTGILGRLEARGYITRERSETDRRSTVIRMTSAGNAVLAQAPSLLQDSFLHRLEQLEPWERTQILSTLQRVAHLMEAQGIDAAPHLTTAIQPPTKPTPQSPTAHPPKSA
ncbi:MAG: MarR family winged helix-turn-helix transcriptional regulator [Phycisphaerales bacterium JB063]